MLFPVLLISLTAVGGINIAPFPATAGELHAQADSSQQRSRALPAVLFLTLMAGEEDQLRDLITPYANEADIDELRNGLSTDDESPPWKYVHDGFDIYPKESLKPFQAVCDGRVRYIYFHDQGAIVWLDCNATYTLEYNFETQKSGTEAIQKDNIKVAEGQTVRKGDIIGNLYMPDTGTVHDPHVHFSFFENWVPICPQPYFSTAAAASMLKLLRRTYPGADLCYGPEPRIPPVDPP